MVIVSDTHPDEFDTRQWNGRIGCSSMPFTPLISLDSHSNLEYIKAVS